MSEHIAYSRADAVAHLVIDRPDKRNALTAEMVEALLAGVRRASADDDVKVIVIRAEGPAFCAGFDITDTRDFHGASDESPRARLGALREKSAWMREFLLVGKPLVVAAHGACVGIGTYLCLVADFALAADDAAFGLPEERFGSAGATWAYPFLIREVGLKRANEIVLTGRRFGAAEFRDLGLVNRVVPRAELATATDGLCAALASLPRDGIALNRAVKELSLAVVGHLDAFPFHAGLHANAERIRREPDEFDFLAAVEADGMRAALERRNREFGGDWWGW